jgi:SAM-dependent methyltransferase
LAFIKPFGFTESATLLDIGCGTGKHLSILKNYFRVEGLDKSKEMLMYAKQNNPELTFYHGDMTKFNTNKSYDIITCLFSSIGYVKTVAKLNKTIACMAKHLKPNGLLIIEPWLTPDKWKSGLVGGLMIDQPELKIARVNTSLSQGKISVFDLHHLIGTPEKTEHFIEHHELTMFEIDEMMQAFQHQNLQVRYNQDGITGRGLYIAQKV